MLIPGIRWLVVAGVLLALALAGVGSAQQGQTRLSVADFMSAAEYQRAGLQKLTDQERFALDTWFTGIVAKLTHASTAPAVRATVGLEALEGAVIVADDGQFLGKITRSDVDRDSLLNDVGPYGSDVSSTSIFNDVGKYGSDVSSYSPFNDVASTPPRIFKGDRFVGYLTVNTIKQPRVDPRLLIGWLKSQ